MNIVAITGTNGAGKGTITKILIEHFSYTHLSVRKLLEELLSSQNLELTRDNMITLANQLRTESGPSILVEMLIDRAQDLETDVIIESIRCPGEIYMLKEKYPNVIVIAVDADQELRYERVAKRGSNTDRISREEFIQHEEQEMANDNPFKQNLKMCIKLSDKIFHNNSTIEELEENVKNYFTTSEVK